MDGSSWPQCKSILLGVLLVPWVSLSPPSCGVHGLEEPLVPQLAHAASVIANRCHAASVVLLPLSSLFGLEPVLVVDSHQAAVIDELLENLGDALAELGAVVGEVLDQEVSDEMELSHASPVSPPMVRLGSCEMRKTRAQMRDFSVRRRRRLEDRG